MRAVRFDLAADSLHEGPHVVGFIGVLTAPDSLQYLAMQQDLARIARQIGQYLELTPREPQLRSVQTYAPRGEVDFQPTILVGCDASAWAVGATSQQHPPCSEIPTMEQERRPNVRPCLGSEDAGRVSG